MSNNQTVRQFLRQLFDTTPTVSEVNQIGPDSVVTPDATRCVQCGVCGFNCPVGIPVRDYAHQGQIVDDPRCVQCGQCVDVCPRGTLRWAPNPRPRRQQLHQLEEQLLTVGVGLEPVALRPPRRQP
jgi:ferredoxin